MEVIHRLSEVMGKASAARSRQRQCVAQWNATQVDEMTAAASNLNTQIL